jgi:hypothetical protein
LICVGNRQLLWLSSESEMVNFWSAIGGRLLLGVRSAARAPLDLQPVDTSKRYKIVGVKTKGLRPHSCGRKCRSAHYRSAQGLCCTPQKHSTSSSQFQAGQRSSLKDTLRYTAAVQIAGDWLRHWVVHGGTLAKAKAEDVL